MTRTTAANAPRGHASIRLQLDAPLPIIEPEIYGHFAEHLGRCIYGGLWVGEGSPIPNTRGIRNDVIAALKQLRVPVLRWPGGCFADEYHWRDGIGPRSKRPKRINTHWGQVIENHQFGTHEFMDLCELIGAKPYVCGNVGSGSPQEMMEWVEYMTSDSDSTLADSRRRFGRKEPWTVPYFGVGNENWGCGGNMRAEYYADNYLRYQTFVKSYSGNEIRRIAGGANGGDEHWTEVLMKLAGDHMDGLSAHWYTLPTGNWKSKGSATVFGEEEWHSTLAHTLRMDEIIRKHSAIMDRYDPEKRVGLIVDEWGAWYDVEPGTDPQLLYQQNSLRDALVASINLNTFCHHAERVKMANIAQLVNVLQAVILTEGEKMVLTPTYHAFEMHALHRGCEHIPLKLEAPEYRLGDESVPMLHAAASRKGNTTHLTLVNLHPERELEVEVPGLGGRAIGRVLTASEMNEHNDFEHPCRIAPVAFEGIAQTTTELELTLPSKSVVALAIVSAKL